MASLPKLGYVALARENSSTSSDGVVKHLVTEGIAVLDIDSVKNEATGVPLNLRLQLVDKNSPEAQKVAQWFMGKKKPNMEEQKATV